MATLLLERHENRKRDRGQDLESGEVIARPLTPGHDELFWLERTLALMVIAVAAIYLRAQQPAFSTAYMDESIYIIYGRMFLSHHFDVPLATPLQWTFGWYLWPAMAALADRVAGLVGVRELAAALGTITVAAVYGFTSRIFSKPVGIGAAAIMAVLAPAVLVSRIATRDSGSICFFALGLWAFACAWTGNRRRHSALAVVAFFAAFLCKYLVAIYFPFLVLVALWKRWKPALFFALPLSAACAAYFALHAQDLVQLLRYGSGYASLRAPAAQALHIYFFDRLDFWLLAAAALPLFFFRESRVRAALLSLGALLIGVFQLKSRADFDYWKHVNYALLFVVPMAAAGAVLVGQRLRRTEYGKVFWSAASVLALAAGAAALGSAQAVQKFVFWPNVEPVLAYFDGRLTPADHLLVDDTVLRYYFGNTLQQHEITDPMYFEYKGGHGAAAYRHALQDGVFSYVVLDGGIGEEARALQQAITPLPANYTLRFSGVEPTLGRPIQVFARSNLPEPQPGAVAVTITSPASRSVVSTNGGWTYMEGRATGASEGWTVQAQVFTDRWWDQGPPVAMRGDGTFRQQVQLGGQGRQQCFHLLRVQLLDPSGKARATAMSYAVARANPDGSAPECVGE